METTIDRPTIALGSFIKFGADGAPYLEGFKCDQCGEIQLELRRGCPKCAAVGSLRPYVLPRHGKVSTYTIVHRSFPGIATPFVSVIVELEGGVFLKGNLVGVAPTPSAEIFNMPVRVEFDHPPVHGKADADVVRYVFVPAHGGHHE